MKTLLLIDGNNLFHRAYHALPPLTAKDGENTNAVFGFSNMLIKAISEVKSDFIACAFDTRAPTFRHVEFENYKAQRVAPPPDLYPQLPKVKKVLGAYGICVFEKEGYEADDLLATIAKEFAGPVSRFHPASARSKLKSNGDQQDNVDLRAVGSPPTTATRKPKTDFQVVILSGDRDLLQMVGGNIKVQMPGWNLTSTTLFGAKEVLEKYGVTPEQMVDYKSLTGDPSDNIPGIAGIGPKNASSLLQKYGTLENLFEHLDEVPESVRVKLQAGKDNALAAKRLVKLDADVDIDLPAGKAGLRVKSLEFRPDWEKVRKEFAGLGFKSIIAKIPGDGNTSEVSDAEPKRTSEVGKGGKDSDKDQLTLI